MLNCERSRRSVWPTTRIRCLALTPLCVAKGEQQPEQLVLLKKESTWSCDAFVTKAGWVANVNEKYRSAVASACATALVEAMDAKHAG